MWDKKWSQIWYRCLRCQRCFEYPNWLVAHKKQTECGKLYPTRAERALLKREDYGITNEQLDEFEKPSQPLPPCLMEDKDKGEDLSSQSQASSEECKQGSESEANDLNPSETGLNCSLCNVGSSDRAAFNRHRRQHGIQKTVCYFCDLDFRGDKALQIHMIQHTRET